MGRLDLIEGDYRTAKSLYQEGLTLRRQLGDTWLIAISLIGLGGVARCQGDAELAHDLLREALTIQRELGNKHGVAWVLQNLGEVAIHRGETANANALFGEALRLRREQRHELGMGLCLLGFAGIARTTGRGELAARLIGAAGLEDSGAGLDPADRLTYCRTLDAVRSELDPIAFAACWQAGQAMTIEQACSLALSLLGPYS
jgi:tetratricopeptide (TPR) repeat protein